LGADQDIDTNRVTVPELDFKSPFVLEPVSTSDSLPTKMRAFLTWFDTFFSPDASIAGQAPLGRDTQYVKYEEDAYRRDVPVVSAKKTGNEGEGEKEGKEVSFTTGPRGKATHWKQVAFMLKEPVEVPAGEFTNLSYGMNGPARMASRGAAPCLLCSLRDQVGRATDDDDEGRRGKRRRGTSCAALATLSLLRACQKEILGLTGHLSFTLFLPLRPPDRGYFSLPKESEWEYARTGRRDPLEGVGTERTGGGCTGAVRRVQGVLIE
jgi:hypothetical protein